MMIVENKTHEAGRQSMIKEMKFRNTSSKQVLRSSGELINASQSARAGNWEWDIAPDALKWDNVMESINGISSECFAGGLEAWEKCMHPDDISRIRNEIYLALTGKKHFDTVIRIVWPDNSFHFIKAVATMLKNEEGNPEYMFGSVWDITEEKFQEQEIIKSEKFYRSLIENSRDIKCLSDLKGIITYISPSVKEILGFEPDELTGRNRLDLIFSEDHKMINEKIQLLLSSPRETVKVEMRCIDINNKIVWCEGYISNLLDVSGIHAVVLNFCDITVRKEFEAKIENQNTELLKINTELDNFVYSASHEMRAPLCSILGLIDLVSYEEKDMDKIEFFNMMKQSVENLDNLIRDIVDYSRNNRQEVKIEEVDFKDQITESILNLKYLPEVQNIRIDTEIKKETNFYTDKKRIAIIINNLLSNAVKYQQAKIANPFIRISANITAQNAFLTVSDNGSGIPENHLDKVFNMFYRASSAKRGAGLGLYIVKEIVEKLSGEVFIFSEEGDGTTVYVSIPNRVNQFN
ncbi:sensor histidine kinase [Daejeonella oryzae]|uniref:sensor histidine kinase n=1 Tax=Daejeonella oryzae TaxID=1122943 RepID=UPI0012DC295F|nr:PAS domain-containing sensor histidine kinase [Daejeonella oryzae]